MDSEIEIMYFKQRFHYLSRTFLRYRTIPITHRTVLVFNCVFFLYTCNECQGVVINAGIKEGSDQVVWPLPPPLNPPVPSTAGNIMYIRLHMNIFDFYNLYIDIFELIPLLYL